MLNTGIIDAFALNLDGEKAHFLYTEKPTGTLKDAEHPGASHVDKPWRRSFPAKELIIHGCY
jgi:hypothetical protein